MSSETTKQASKIVAGVIPGCLLWVSPALSGYRPRTLGDEGTVTLSQKVGSGGRLGLSRELPPWLWLEGSPDR